MVRLLLNGCNGKMGRVISQCVAGRDDCKIVAGADIVTERVFGYPGRRTRSLTFPIPAP